MGGGGWFCSGRPESSSSSSSSSEDNKSKSKSKSRGGHGGKFRSQEDNDDGDSEDSDSGEDEADDEGGQHRSKSQTGGKMSTIVLYYVLPGLLLVGGLGALVYFVILPLLKPKPIGTPAELAQKFVKKAVERSLMRTRTVNRDGISAELEHYQSLLDQYKEQLAQMETERDEAALHRGVRDGGPEGGGGSEEEEESVFFDQDKFDALTAGIADLREARDWFKTKLKLAEEKRAAHEQKMNALEEGISPIEDKMIMWPLF